MFETFWLLWNTYLTVWTPKLKTAGDCFDWRISNGDCFDWSDDAHFEEQLPLCRLSSLIHSVFYRLQIARMEGNSVFPLLLLLLLLSASRCSDAQLPLPRLDPRSPLTSHHHNQGLPSLLALLKTLPKSTRGSGIPLRPCSFKATTQRLESGTCTWYGACRFQGRDYMYQVRFSRGYLLSQILGHMLSTRPISR